MATAEPATTTVDPLLGGRIRLRQPRRGYRVAIDPVLLAAAVPERYCRRVLDAGAGTGAASLCLAARVPDCRIVALERDPEAAALPAAVERRAATVESLPVADWVGACLRRLAPRGRLLLVHRADRLAEIVAALAGGCGDLRLFPLWPRADSREAERLLVLARKGVRSPAHLLRGLVLHRPGGGYTPEAERVLRDLAPLDLLATRERGT